jgi:hypothetical protein
MKQTSPAQLLRSNSQLISFDGPDKIVLVKCDSVDLHWLYRETMLRLSVLAERCREGVDVSAASEFARFVQGSGLIKLFRSNPQAEPFEVDGAKVEKAVRDLLWDCGERLRRALPGMVEASALERVHHKLDLIAGQLIKISASGRSARRSKSRAVVARLHVLRGGVS